MEKFHANSQGRPGHGRSSKLPTGRVQHTVTHTVVGEFNDNLPMIPAGKTDEEPLRLVGVELNSFSSPYCLGHSSLLCWQPFRT